MRISPENCKVIPVCKRDPRIGPESLERISDETVK